MTVELVLNDLPNNIFFDHRISKISSREFQLLLFLHHIYKENCKSCAENAEILQNSSKNSEKTLVFNSKLLPNYLFLRNSAFKQVFLNLEKSFFIKILKFEDKTAENAEILQKKRKKEKSCAENAEILQNSEKVVQKMQKKTEIMQKDAEKDENRQLKSVYIEAYLKRYGVEPITQNAKFNSIVIALKKRVGFSEAINLIKFYLSIENNLIYSKKMHILDFCLQDAEALVTQMKTGKSFSFGEFKSKESFIDIDNMRKRLNKHFEEKNEEDDFLNAKTVEENSDDTY